MQINYIKIVIFSLFFIQCGSKEKSFPAYGVIYEVFPDKKEMLIHHDEIPGFMMAMTMRLKVDSSIQFNDWSRGDSIKFEIIIADNSGFIRSFKRLGRVEIPIDESDFWEDEDSATQIGGIFPDATFLTLDSTEVSLSNNNGEYRFISFVFSRCPMPNMCPALMMKYRYLASELKEINNLEFVTISFDYIFDNPSTLKKHYNSIITPFPNWNLWSSFGHSSDMISFAHYSQFAFWGVEDNDIGHSMMSVLISPDLKLLKAWDGTDWKAVNIKKDIEKMLLLY
jgi:protein SCO1/2